MLKTMRGFWMVWTIWLIAGTTMAAQNVPSGKWWRSPRVVKALGLTAGEVQRLDDAFRQSRSKMIKQKSRVEKEQLALENMMNRRKLNEAAIRKQNRKLEKARSDLADAKFSFVIQVRKIIGHARFQRLVELKPSR